MEQHDTRVRYPQTPGDRWTRDRFAFDSVVVRRRPRFARLLDQPTEADPTGEVYRSLVVARAAAWEAQEATGYDTASATPSTREARFWHAQGRVEAYAEAMTEIERKATL